MRVPYSAIAPSLRWTLDLYVDPPTIRQGRSVPRPHDAYHLVVRSPHATLVAAVRGDGAARIVAESDQVTNGGISIVQCFSCQGLSEGCLQLYQRRSSPIKASFFRAFSSKFLPLQLCTAFQSRCSFLFDLFVYAFQLRSRKQSKTSATLVETKSRVLECWKQLQEYWSSDSVFRTFQLSWYRLDEKRKLVHRAHGL